MTSARAWEVHEEKPESKFHLVTTAERPLVTGLSFLAREEPLERLFEKQKRQRTPIELSCPTRLRREPGQGVPRICHRVRN